MNVPGLNGITVNRAADLIVDVAHGLCGSGQHSMQSQAESGQADEGADHTRDLVRLVQADGQEVNAESHENGECHDRATPDLHPF